MSRSKNVLSAGDENARTPGLAPHSLVAGRSFGPVIVPWVQFALVDPELSLEEKQLLQPRVRVSGIFDAR
jgi:hypothetical protein